MCVNHRQTVYMCRVYISWQTTDENRPANSFRAAGIYLLLYIFGCMFMHTDLSYRTLSSHATVDLHGVFTVYMSTRWRRKTKTYTVILCSVYTPPKKTNILYFSISSIKCLLFRTFKVGCVQLFTMPVQNSTYPCISRHRV